MNAVHRSCMWRWVQLWHRMLTARQAGSVLAMTCRRSDKAPAHQPQPYRQQSKDPRTLVPTATLISSAGVSSRSRLPVTAPALLTHRCTVPSFSTAKSPNAATSARVDVQFHCRPFSVLTVLTSSRSVSNVARLKCTCVLATMLMGMRSAC